MNENWMILGGFFLFVLGAASVIGYFVIRRRETESQLAEFSADLIIGGQEESDIKATMLGAFQALGAMLPSSETSRDLMKQRLSYAGYRQAVILNSYFGFKFAVAIVTGFLVALVSSRSAENEASAIFGAFIGGMGLGFLLPDRFLGLLITRRSDRLRRGLPPALDLIVMSLEAGQPLDQALILASRGLEKFSPELASELSQVFLETRASKSRADALRHLASRNGEPELTKLCSLLLDADRFGSSLAPTLRQHAKYLRVRSRQRAQEQARKLSVKMVFPVFFLIFPSILVITLGPAVLMLMRVFKDYAN